MCPVCLGELPTLPDSAASPELRGRVPSERPPEAGVRRGAARASVRRREGRGWTPGDSTLLLELMDGGSLNSLVRGSQGGFPETALADAAAQALSGLEYLRARASFTAT